MSAPHIHPRYRTVPASLLLETLGESLGDIKREDGATWGDVGQVLGKSDDRAAAYAAGNGDMGVVSFLRGCREWDGRFANAALALVGMRVAPLDAEEIADSEKLCRILKLGHLIATAISDTVTPGVVDDGELDTITETDLDDAARAIDALRKRKAGKQLRLIART